MLVWVWIGAAIGLALMVVLVQASIVSTSPLPPVSSKRLAPPTQASTLPPRAESPGKLRVVSVLLGSTRHRGIERISAPPPAGAAPRADEYILVCDQTPAFDTAGWTVVPYLKEAPPLPEWIAPDSVQSGRYRARACKWLIDWGKSDKDVTVWIDFKDISTVGVQHFASHIERAVQLARNTNALVQDQYPWELDVDGKSSDY